MSEQLALLDVDPHAPRDYEAYWTPRWQTEALLRRIALPRGAHVVEPMAGTGAIADVLEARQVHSVWRNDLIQRDVPLDSTLDATLRDTWVILAAGPIDAVITNVAFSLALAMLEHAVLFSPFVATILRRTWDEPAEDKATGHDRGAWLATHPCSAQIVLPRYSYRGTGDTDGVTTAWFIWDRAGYVRQPFDVVTKAERDALIAEFGPR